MLTGSAISTWSVTKSCLKMRSFWAFPWVALLPPPLSLAGLLSAPLDAEDDRWNIVWDQWAHAQLPCILKKLRVSKNCDFTTLYVGNHQQSALITQKTKSSNNHVNRLRSLFIITVNLPTPVTIYYVIAHTISFRWSHWSRLHLLYSPRRGWVACTMWGLQAIFVSVFYQ